MSTSEKTPVIQFCVSDLLYERARQPLPIHGCVTKITIAKFYGSYKITDKEGRVIASSTGGSVSLARSDLKTEEAKLWYDSIAGFSPEYKDLKTKVSEPGLCFSHIPEVFIQFEEAPSVEEEPDRKFDHIHMLYSVNNFWNTTKKRLLF